MSRSILGIGVAVLALWLATPFIVGAVSEPAEGAGTFGDQFGAFTALMSALGFLAAGYSLFEQQKQLATQQKELTAQVELQRSHVDAAVRQAEIAALSTLLNLRDQQRMRASDELLRLIGATTPGEERDAQMAALERLEHECAQYDAALVQKLGIRFVNIEAHAKGSSRAAGSVTKA